MAFVLADRVYETTATTGTGDITLAGAVTGYQAFADALADGDTTWYVITDGTDWETGLGTFTAAGTVLARTTVIESSNADAAVDWAAGDKDVFISQPGTEISTVKNVSVGTGLDVTNADTTPTIDLDFSELPTEGSISGTSDALVFYDDSTGLEKKIRPNDLNLNPITFDWTAPAVDTGISNTADYLFFYDATDGTINRALFNDININNFAGAGNYLNEFSSPNLQASWTFDSNFRANGQFTVATNAPNTIQFVGDAFQQFNNPWLQVTYHQGENGGTPILGPGLTSFKRFKVTGNIMIQTPSNDLEHVPSSTYAVPIFLMLSHGGNHTVTWDSDVSWPGGSAPTLQSTSDTDWDIITFVFDSVSNKVFGNYWGVYSE